MVPAGASLRTLESGAGTTRTLRLSITRITRHRVDDRDLLDREVGNDLDAVLVNDQHFLDAHAPFMGLAVLGLEREHHPLLDLHRVVERPDARDHWRIVLRQTEAVTPQIGRGLILFLVAPGFLRRGPFERDLARGRADLHRLDRVVEPLERGRVVVILLLCGFLTYAVGAVVARFVAVPG